MTAIFYRRAGKTLKRGKKLSVNKDGTIRIRPNGWTKGGVNVLPRNVFTPDQIEDVGGKARHIWRVKED